MTVLGMGYGFLVYIPLVEGLVDDDPACTIAGESCAFSVSCPFAGCLIRSRLTGA